MLPPPGAVHHLAVLVRDLPRATRFYAEVLGLAVVRRWPADGPGDRSVWLDLGGGAFLALEHSQAEAVTYEHLGLHLVALRIERGTREAWSRRLAAAGHPITHFTSYTLYARDPEGNRLALSHWPEAASD